MSNPVIGAQLYTLRAFCKTIPDIAQSLKKVAAIGYPAVQVSGFGPVDPKEVAKVLQDSGLNCCATHVGWPRFLTDLDALIEEHRMWNCYHPAIGGLPAEYFSAEGVKRFVDELGPVAEKLARAGMDFSYHNHNHELMRYGEKTWLEMLYQLGSPKILKAEIDTYWITAGGGDPAAWVRKLFGRQPLLHLKDMALVMPGREQHFAEIGEGNLNWQAILQAARESGVQYMLVEQDDCYGRDPFESLAISYRNLKNMGA